MRGLAARGVTKRYGGLTVADAVDLTLEPGCRVALIGPNGAGKTTLADILTGITAPSSGRVLLDGADITGLGEAQRVRAGIAKTFQITALFPGLTLRDNLRLGLIERRRASWRPFARARGDAEVEAEADALLASLGLLDLGERRAGDLPYGAQRLADIALALALKSRVLILDEPAAGVPAGERARLAGVLAALPADLAVLIIEHDMDLVFRLAERIVVMVQGAVLTEGPPEAIAADPRVRELYLGRGVAEPLLALDGVSAGYGTGRVIEDVSLALAPGERLAVLGRNGAGKTTLLRTALGQTRLHAGRVRLAGRDVTALAPYARARAGLGLVPQTRDIFPSLSVEENLVAGAPGGRPDLDRAYALFPRLAERRRIGGTRLSGGEQQMLSVARTLMGRPRVLMLDEPLEGLAPALSDTLMAAFETLAAGEGRAVVLVESRIDAALAFADRVAILEAGHVVWQGPPDTLAARPDLLERHIGIGAAG